WKPVTVSGRCRSPTSTATRSKERWRTFGTPLDAKAGRSRPPPFWTRRSRTAPNGRTSTSPARSGSTAIARTRQRVRRAPSFGPWWPLRRGTRRAENRTHGLSHGAAVDGLTEQLSFRLGEPQPNILAGLTPAQRRAADHGEGPLLVVPGPGTGKT